MNKNKKISSKFIYFFGAFGSALFGYDIGVMTGALPFIKESWGLIDPAIIGWITSSLLLGAIVGGVASGFLSDKIGRRKVIIIAALLFAFGSVLSGISPVGFIAWLLVSRFILGLGVGAASSLVPSYMSEMAPAKNRGRLSGLNQLMIVAGMLISYVVDFALQGAPESLSWRLMLGLAALPAIILFFGVLRLPESPRYLVNKNKSKEAKYVLSLIRSKEEIDSELNDIEDTAKKESDAQKSVTFLSIFSKKYRYLVVAGVGVATFQQFMGTNAIFYYIPLIVERATGQSASSSGALLWPVIQGVLLVLGALFFLLIADKVKRKTLLTIGGIALTSSFFMPALLNTVIGAENLPPVLIVLFLSTFVAFYSFTWGPLTWVIVGEIFPLAIRGRATGLASSMNWLGSFVVGLIFPIMTAYMSQDLVFAIFGVVCLCALLFMRFVVPETRGKSLEEIEQECSGR